MKTITKVKAKSKEKLALKEYGFGTGVAATAQQYLMNSTLQGLNEIFTNNHQNINGGVFNGFNESGQIMAFGGVTDSLKTKVIPTIKQQPIDQQFVDNNKLYLDQFSNKWGTPIFNGGNGTDGYKFDLIPNAPQVPLMSTEYSGTMAPGQGQRVTPTPATIKPSANSNFAMGGEVKDNIHIKSSHKGLFTKWAKDHNMSVSEAASHVMANKGKYSSHVVKMANFAKNFAALGDSSLQPMNSPQQQLQGNPNVPVEVEGGEVAQTPQGQLGQFQGPSHEEGGIPANLPQGTKIYSDRLAVDGKTMQARKLSRERSIAKLNNMIDKNPTDALNRNTYNRMKSRADMEEQQDLMMQDAANQIYQKTPQLQDASSGFQTPMENSQEQYQQLGDLGQVQGAGVPRQFAFGTGDEGDLINGNPTQDSINNIKLPTNNILPTSAVLTNPYSTSTNKTNTDMPYSTGDKLGFLGNELSGALPLATTIADRAGDKPNVNAFQNFGKNAIDANDKGMGFLNVVRDEALKNSGIAATTQRARNRNSATSVNTNRALDLATTGQENISENNIYSQYAQQMAGMYNERSKLSNQQDLYSDTGQQTANKEDRMDRDSYYTNLAQNLGNIGHGLNSTGKEMNEHDYNNQAIGLLSYLNKYGVGIRMNPQTRQWEQYQVSN